MPFEKKFTPFYLDLNVENQGVEIFKKALFTLKCEDS